MQNLQTLLDLGFRPYTDGGEGDYVFYGKKQTFIARVLDEKGDPYIRLYMLSDKIDNRPLSSRRGLPYINPVKDCCSSGSAEQAIKMYDVETDRINFYLGGASLK